MNQLADPLHLPCGAQFKNRIAKAAMSDSMGDGAGNPTDAQARLYERWALGGAALTLIGEVQIDPWFPEKPGNLVLVPDADIAKLKSLAQRGSANGAHIWPQLGHAGALSFAPVNRPKGPSPLNLPDLTCDGFSVAEIEALPKAYADAALIAKDVGFTGVQIHAGHGFLFSQFLSPLFNHRDDDYGGSIAARFNIIGQVIDAVRRAVGPTFPIGIKFNCTDQLEGGLTTNEGLDVIKLLDQTSIDLIEVSGGTYFPGAPSSSDRVTDGPYFVEFGKQAKTLTNIPIMLVGGFRTRAQAVDAITNGAADMISLGRAMALNPDLANTWMDPVGANPEFPRFPPPPPGGITAWYSMRLTAIGEDREQVFNDSLEQALANYDARDAARVEVWTKRFGTPK